VIASSGRDRTVQVFQKLGGEWELSQTLDEHAGAVTGLLFSADGGHLLSCSSDRSVVVREALKGTANGYTSTAFVIVRTIVLKVSPVSMALPSGVDDIVTFSTVDRFVHKYNFRNGQLSTSFKASDAEGGDAVVISSLVHIPNGTGQQLVAGVSSTDKSLRIYDDNGNLFGRDWGHTEGVTDLTLISNHSCSDQRYLVTVAADGTVFVWNIESKGSIRRDVSRSMDLAGDTPSSGNQLLVHKPVLRRVLSQSEMARFQQRSPEEDVNTPTGKRAPKLEKRPSRFSLAQRPRIDPSPVPSFDTNRRRTINSRRSPSPPQSPRNAQRSLRRRPSLEPRSRTKSGSSTLASDPFSLSNSTNQVCRSLRAYRKKLADSPDHLNPDTLRELERELGLTARAVAEKAMKSRGHEQETVMVKLLSQYSERLLEMLDEKFAATHIKRAKVDSAGEGSSNGSINGAEDAGEGVAEGQDENTPPRSLSTPNSATIEER
jgi:WD domain, G-beta repeat